MTAPLKQLPPSAVIKTPQVFRSRDRCRRYRRIGKPLKRSFAARGTLENLCRDALSLGIEGTPSVFLNGRMIGGVVEYEALVQLLRDELERLGAPAVRK